MQKESLSVGNYVMYKGEKFIISKAEAIEYAANFKPIWLDVHTLIAFGFNFCKVWKNTLVLKVGNFTISYGGMLDVGFFLNDIRIDIKYLHELQNLYRLLSGGLELKLIDI